MASAAFVLTGAPPSRPPLRQWTQITALMALRTFRLRYLRSRLGIGWAIVQPLVQAVVLSFIFTKVFKIARVPHYTLYVLSGILTWQMFSASVSSATTSAVDNAGLLRKISMPSIIFPLSVVGAQGMVYLLQLAVLLVYAGVVGTLSVQVLLIPLLLFMVTLAATSVGVLTCAFHVAFRDIKFFVESGILIFFYATPILYDPAQLSPGIRTLLAFNPMFGVVQVARGALLDRHVNWATVGISLGELSVLLVVAVLLFRRRSADFADLA